MGAPWFCAGNPSQLQHCPTALHREAVVHRQAAQHRRLGQRQSGCHAMPTSPISILPLAVCCPSFVCDELDGRFARKFNQTSTLGAVLDMVTDRWVGWRIGGEWVEYGWFGGS